MDIAIDIKNAEDPSPLSFADASASENNGTMLHRFKQNGSVLLRHPAKIPAFIKREIRTRGMSYAGNTELLMSVGVCVSTTGVFLSNLSFSFQTLSLGILALAEILWFSSHLAAAIPIPAIDEKEKATREPKTFLTHGFSALPAETRKNIRGNLIRASAVLDAAASISYAAAGIMLNDYWMPASSVWYVVSDKIRYSNVQGTDVPFPAFDQDTPWRVRAKGYASFVKDIYKNNPNLKAESLSYPGILISLTGLAQVLPLDQIAVFVIGYSAASFCRASSLAIQETNQESEKTTNRQTPRLPLEKLSR